MFGSTLRRLPLVALLFCSACGRPGGEGAVAVEVAGVARTLTQVELAALSYQRTRLVKAVAGGARPARSETPLGPIIAETSGSSASSTYEARDLLVSPDRGGCR